MITVIAPPRGADNHGNGAYNANRKRGAKRYKHQGVDLAVWPNSIVLAGVSGRISKIGYPYLPDDSPKGRLRYVELSTALDYRIRYFYIDPVVVAGEIVHLHQALGSAQDLRPIFGADMTPHVHLEVINPNGKHINPKAYFEVLS